MVGTAANRRLAKLHVAPVDDIARPDAVQAMLEVFRTEPRLDRRCINSSTTIIHLFIPRVGLVRPTIYTCIANYQLYPRVEPKDPNIIS